MRLLIVSSVTHYRHAGRLWAHAHYAREIEIWADLFPEVMIAAPCRDSAPPADAVPFEHDNIDIAPQVEAGGDSIRAKLGLLLAVPAIVVGLVKALRSADAAHVRCPGNLGLLATIVAPMFCSRLIAKYAGQWNGYPGEPVTVWLQRALLRSRWWRGPVTVYGSWPDQPPHVVPFFTSMLSSSQLERGRRAAAARIPGPALRAVYVGRLVPSKNVDTLLAAAARLRGEGARITCSIVGEGPDRTRLESLAARLALDGNVMFHGGVSHAGVLEFLERADVLVLVSQSEGWSKAVAEGMAFGLVCIGPDHGYMKQILAGGRGIALQPGDVDSLCLWLKRIASNPAEFEPMRARALNWASQFSLEGLRDSLGRLLEERWNEAPGSIAVAARPNPGEGAP